MSSGVDFLALFGASVRTGVDTLGLLPAALSHAIGSDSQRPFAIVIVGGLIVDLIMSIFLLPTFYVWWAGLPIAYHRPSNRGVGAPTRTSF